MNASLMAFGEWQSIVDAPVCFVLLLKITAILSAAWLVHAALSRRNPRWQVLLWRLTGLGLIALPVIAWFLPSLNVSVATPLPARTAAVDSIASENTPVDRATVDRAAADRSMDRLAHDGSAGISTDGREGASLQGVSPLPPSNASLPAPIEPSILTWPRLLLVAWLSGIAVLAIRLVLGRQRFLRSVCRANRPPQWVRKECSRVARAIGCRGNVDVVLSERVHSPLLCGIHRPMLLLPARMCDEPFSPDLPGVFAHELTHVRCHDLFWNAGLHMISIVLWFHPLAWRLRKAHLAACELVCDAASASFVGDVAGYCRTLARVAIEAYAPLPAAGIAMARTSAIGRRLNALKTRVFHLPLRRRSVLGVGFVSLLAVAVLGTLQFVLAAPPAAEPIVAAEETKAGPAEKEEKPVEGADATSETSSLLVRVVDEAGKPLVGTKLTAKYLGHENDYTADAEGKAKVIVPGPNRLFLSLIAYPDGYPPVRKWWRNDSGNELIPDEFTFTFDRGRTIGGVVRDEQGKPVQGVKVHLSISAEKLEQSNMCLALWDRVFLTDAEGRWHLDHVPEKTKSIGVGLEHPDYISVPGPQQLSAAQQRQVEDCTAAMVMKKGISVSGTVTDPDGKPVEGATVTLGEWHSPKQPTASTDPQGRYRFASLAPGGTVLTVTHPGLAPALHNIKVQPQMKPVDFRLEKGNTLRVRVVDEDGKPISGVFVTPDTWHGHRVLCDVGIKGRTDAEGRWTWTWAPKDAVKTDFALTGHVNYMSVRGLPLAPQEAEHVVTLYPALTISGQVVDAETKQPVPSFHVVRGNRQAGSFEHNVFWDRHQVVEGKNGQYKLMITQPSLAHLVRIEADGYQPAVSREFKNEEGSVTCDFAMHSGKSLNVAVRLPDGKPAEGAEVSLSPEDRGKFVNTAVFVKNGGFPYPNMSKPTLKVGPDGQLSIQPQDNPFVLVVVHDQGFAQTTSEELAAKPEIALQAWARLEGTVRHGTKPVAGAKLVVDPAGPFDARWGFLNFQEQTEADADGKFIFAKLKPGKWQVRLLPVDQNGRSPNDQSVELRPGQTVRITLGGTGRPVVGRLQWPGGKPPEGDLSKMGVNVGPKLPERPSPPKEVRDQGPDAVRTWMKQWQESEEGKAWQKDVQKQYQRQQIALVDNTGLLRIEEAVAGEYQLSVYVKANDGSLPWERPEMLRYEGEFSVPEIPGGVSDQPLDLGNVALSDKTPQNPSFGDVKPPARQAAGEKSVGGLRDNLDLLRYVVTTYKQNKAKIQTWQGKATVESRETNEKMAMGHDDYITVEFVFDRAKKSLRWNTTLEKWTKSTKGREEPQPVPQISNGMVTPEAFYRICDGSSGWPANPAKRPLTLTIAASDDPRADRIQPQLYDFNPLFYLDTFRGDVAQDLAAYLGWAEHPGLATMKVTREGDHVTIDMGSAESYNRYTLNLSQGCNPISCEGVSPGMTSEWRWTYEKIDGIWLPKTWIATIHQKDARDELRKVTLVENLLNQPVEPTAFSLPRLGLQTGDKVQDRRVQPMNRYQYEGE